MFHLSSVLAFGLVGAAIANPIAGLVKRNGSAPIAITSLAYWGEGCPYGSLNGTLAETGQFDVFYQDLTASIQPGDAKVKVKCHIEVGLQTYADTQLVVAGGTYEGKVCLTEGAWAKQQNQYKFANSPGTTNMQWVFEGPTEVQTKFTNELNVTFASGCHSGGGAYTLIINNYLTLTSEDGGQGSIEVTELDGAITQSIQLSTANC